EAEELEVQVIETFKRVLGEEHPDTLTSMNNLAFTLKGQGYQGKAISLMEGCFQLREKVLGPQHPYTASSLSCLNEWRLEAMNIAKMCWNSSGEIFSVIETAILGKRNCRTRFGTKYRHHQQGEWPTNSDHTPASLDCDNEVPEVGFAYGGQLKATLLEHVGTGRVLSHSLSRLCAPFTKLRGMFHHPGYVRAPNGAYFCPFKVSRTSHVFSTNVPGLEPGERPKWQQEQIRIYLRLYRHLHHLHRADLPRRRH
ncbi:uncharacterized protein BDR25DRAFT_350908, partial [Lindgomyces ingoldianus]